jgi:hypothetical protein
VIRGIGIVSPYFSGSSPDASNQLAILAAFGQRQMPAPTLPEASGPAIPYTSVSIAPEEVGPGVTFTVDSTGETFISLGVSAGQSISTGSSSDIQNDLNGVQINLPLKGRVGIDPQGLSSNTAPNLSIDLSPSVEPQASVGYNFVTIDVGKLNLSGHNSYFDK